MSICKPIKRPKRTICIGDMRDQIILYTRSIASLGTLNPDFVENLTASVTIWASIETKSGVEIFDGTNLIGVATHLFYIRYVAGLTQETWLEFNNEYYDILDIQNFEERSAFMVLRCSIRGDKTKATNLK